MRTPALFRRREVWLPTTWSFLALGLSVLLLLLLAIGQIHAFLAPSAPIGHGLLLVEGWLRKTELLSAIEVFQRGDYELLVATGGPASEWDERYPTYADRAGDFLLRHGIRRDQLVVVSAPASAQERTYRSAITVRDWIEQTGRVNTAIDVYSRGPHSRRTWNLYRTAFGHEAPIGVIAAAPTEYDASTWWRTSAGARTVIYEALAWAWTECCFNPGPRGSHEEKWGTPSRD
jgi:hypothetical protein